MKKFPLEIDTTVKYDFHMRYQQCTPGGGLANISFGGDTEAMLDCEQVMIGYLSTNYKD